MKRLLPLLLLAAPAHAALSPRDLAQAVARPPADAHLPASPAFADREHRTTLGRLAQGKPAILVFADYSCRHVCGPGLTLLGQALADTGKTAGRDYTLLVIGIDPTDSPAIAQAMAARLGPIAPAAHILTGDAAAIAAVTHALGYGVVYDPDADQFAHDASVYLFRPDGRLATLLPELGLTAPMLRAALDGTVVKPSLTDRIARLCYGLAGEHGGTGRAVWWGMATIAALLVAAGTVLLRKAHRA